MRARSDTGKQTAPMPFGKAEAEKALQVGFGQLEAAVKAWHRPASGMSIAAFVLACAALFVAVFK